VIILSCFLLKSGKGGRFSGGFDTSVMKKVNSSGKIWWYDQTFVFVKLGWIHYKL